VFRSDVRGWGEAPPPVGSSDAMSSPWHFYGLGGLGNFAAAPTGVDRALLQAKMYAALGALKSAADVAYTSTNLAAKVHGLVSWLPFNYYSYGEEQKNIAVRSALNSIKAMLQQREERVAAVLDGSLAAEKWFVSLDAVAQAMTSIMSELNEPIVFQHIKASLDELAAVTKRVGGALAKGAETLANVVPTSASGILGLTTGVLVLIAAVGTSGLWLPPLISWTSGRVSQAWTSGRRGRGRRSARRSVRRRARAR